MHGSTVKEEFLMCESLTITTKGEDIGIFNVMNTFLEKNGLERMDGRIYVGLQQISVDGAPAMMGGNRDFKGFVQIAHTDIAIDLCSCIHRFSLGSKTLPPKFSAVFTQVVKIVNFIESKDLNCRVFKELCKDMREKYEVLLYHTEVR